MRNFRKLLAALLLVFAFLFAISINSFADDEGVEEISQGIGEGEKGNSEESVTEETAGEVGAKETQIEEKTEETTEGAADTAEREEGIEEYAKRLVDKFTSSSFVTSIATFVVGVLALMLTNNKTSTKLLGFIGEKADSALVKKQFKGLEELDKDIMVKQEELAETVKQVSVALMLIAEYLPSVPSTVKGELFKTFSCAKESGNNILDVLKDTKEKIEEATASIPAIDTSAIAKVLTDVQAKADAEKDKDQQHGTIDLG